MLTMMQRLVLIFAALATCPLAFGQNASEQSKMEAKVEIQLEAKTTLEFQDVEFRTIVNEISVKHKLKIHIDPSLKDAGISLDDLVSVSFSETRLRTVFDLMLGKYDCTYLIKDDLLIILSKEEANYQRRIKVYPVRDLLEKFQEEDPTLLDEQLAKTATSKPMISADTRHEMTHLLEVMIDAESWEAGGGEATLRIINGQLIISQTEINHAKIRQLMGQLRDSFKLKK